MALDRDLLSAATAAGQRLGAAEHDARAAHADYHHAVRRLHVAGAPLREVAQALGISHQRVQQIVKATGGTWWTRMWRTRRISPDMTCSFCLRPSERVAKLIAGPEVFICDACVLSAEQVLRTKKAKSTGHQRALRRHERDTGDGRCGGWHRVQRLLGALPTHPRRLLVIERPDGLARHAIASRTRAEEAEHAETVSTRSSRRPEAGGRRVFSVSSNLRPHFSAKYMYRERRRSLARTYTALRKRCSPSNPSSPSIAVSRSRLFARASCHLRDTEATASVTSRTCRTVNPAFFSRCSLWPSGVKRKNPIELRTRISSFES